MSYGYFQNPRNCETHFEWKIENFFALTSEVDKFYDSPQFSSPGHLWHLRLYPGGESVHKSTGWIALYLFTDDDTLKWTKVDITFGIKNEKGDVVLWKELQEVTFSSNLPYGWRCFLKREDLLRKKSSLAPLDFLTVTCCLKHDIPDNIKSNEISAVAKIGTVNTTYRDKTKLKGVDLLSEDLMDAFMKGENTDLTINVKGKTFYAHKVILKARSEFFFTMLEIKIKGKEIDVIDITDCDPEAFEVFLIYLYTAKVDKLNEDNVCKVYYIANKCGHSDLKVQCIPSIIRYISIENICTVLELARKHAESDIMQHATQFFKDNLSEILQTEDWQIFKKNNPLYVDELYMNAVKKPRLC